MFKTITYKQKFYALILSFLMLLLASYKRKISKLLDVKSKIDKIDKNQKNIEESNFKILFIKNEIKNLDDVIGGSKTDPEDVQQKILDFITKKGFVNNLVSIENVHLNSKNEFLIYTNQIILESNYETLINTLYDIEKHFLHSRVISTKLYLKRKFNINNEKIYLKIIFQNYEKKQ